MVPTTTQGKDGEDRLVGMDWQTVLLVQSLS
jgi:hypothetical protein